jgi:Rhs element Vgr protein
VATSPLDGSDGPVTVAIKSDGQAIPDTARVLAVRTRAEINRIPEAVLVLADGDVATNEFPLTDGALFKPGAAIVVEAGYGGGPLAEIFKGVVVGQRLRILDEGEPRLEVSCRAGAFKLTLGRRNRSFKDGTDSDAISSIIGEAGLSATVSATTATLAELVQYYCTDWDFILARAEANGFLVTIVGDAVTVGEPGSTDTAVLSVGYGTELLRFDAEVEARGQFAKVEARGWDPASQALATGSATPSGAPTWGDLTASALAAVGGLDSYLVQSAAPIDAGSLQTIAKARIARAALARQRGEARFQGSAKAVPGAVLELKGLGTRFGGKALIGRVVHRIEDGNWITEAGLGLPAESVAERPGAAEAPAAGGVAPPVRGLQVATVKKLDADPAGGFRIQVDLPVQGDGGASVWARVAAPYATAGQGVMFLPEIGDEVVVGFLADDPSVPVVLGALHSSGRAPPLTPSEANLQKKILTKAGLAIAFDDEKKAVTVETPGGNTVVLDDEAKSITLKDQHGNSLVLDQGGITLDSKGKVAIKAAQDVTVTATGAVKASATSDLELAGLNVKATGQVSFAASGAASAEVKATGPLTLQGALVKIN